MQNNMLSAVISNIILLIILFNPIASYKLKLEIGGFKGDGLEGPFNMTGVRYLSNINILSSDQTFKITFDTRFNDIFVPAKLRPNSTNRKLHFNHGFDTRNSTILFADQLEFSNRTSLSGNWIIDRLQIYFSTFLTLNETIFVAQDSSRDLGYELWDGVVGLGPHYKNDRTGQASLIIALKNAKIIDKAQFSLMYNKPWAKNVNMTLRLGYLDTSLVPNMQIFSGIYRDKYDWFVGLSPVWLGNEPIGCGRGYVCHAILNSGSSATYGPKDQVEKLYKQLGFKQDINKMSDTYIDCDSIRRDVQLKFTFQGRDRIFPSEYYIMQTQNASSGTQICYVTIYPHDIEDKWLLGTNWLSAYYTAYDMEEDQLLIAH